MCGAPMWMVDMLCAFTFVVSVCMLMFESLAAKPATTSLHKAAGVIIVESIILVFLVLHLLAFEYRL